MDFSDSHLRRYRPRRQQPLRRNIPPGQIKQIPEPSLIDRAEINVGPAVLSPFVRHGRKRFHFLAKVGLLIGRELQHCAMIIDPQCHVDLLLHAVARPAEMIFLGSARHVQRHLAHALWIHRRKVVRCSQAGLNPARRATFAAANATSALDHFNEAHFPWPSNAAS